MLFSAFNVFMEMFVDSTDIEAFGEEKSGARGSMVRLSSLRTFDSSPRRPMTATLRLAEKSLHSQITMAGMQLVDADEGRVVDGGRIRSVHIPRGDGTATCKRRENSQRGRHVRHLGDEVFEVSVARGKRDEKLRGRRP